jgi:hypothetical protein
MGTTAIPVKTKTCPECAEEIKEEALVCHYCGQRFEVTHSGYCAHCHEIVAAAEDGTCSVCGGGLVDIRTTSTALAGAAAPVTEPASAPTAPTVEPIATVVPGKMRTGIVPTLLQRITFRVNVLAAWALGLLVLVQLGAKSQLDNVARTWDPPQWIFVATRDLANGYEFLILGGAFFVLAIVGLVLAPWRLRPRTGLRFGPSKKYRAMFESQRPRREESQRELGVPVKFGKPVLFRKGGFRPKLAIAVVLWLAGLAYFVSEVTSLRKGFSMELGGYAAVALLVAGLVSAGVLLLTRPKRMVRADEWGVVYPAED